MTEKVETYSVDLSAEIYDKLYLLEYDVEFVKKK
jgi:hypothetical protein